MIKFNDERMAMSGEAGAAATDTSALLYDNRLRSNTINFVDDVPRVLIGIVQSPRGDPEASAALDLLKEFDRCGTQEALSISSDVNLQFNFDHAGHQRRILILADHDLRGFDDGIGDVAHFEVKIFNRLPGNDRCHDIALSQIDLHSCGDQSFFDEYDLAFQFISRA